MPRGASRSRCQPFGVVLDLCLAGNHHAQVKFWLEAAMQGPVVCTICEKTEQYCTCEKYCTICKGQHNVHLAADGLYYCPDCREACDVAWASSSER